MDFPAFAMPAPHVLTPFALDSVGGFRGSGGTPNIHSGLASGQWPVANQALLFPFSLFRPEIARKLLRLNGDTVTGTCDIGIYDAEGRLIVAAGSTTITGTAVVQEFDIADTPLVPGEYFLAASASATGGNVYRVAASDEAILPSSGLYQASSSHPLPSTITPVFPQSGTSPVIPLIGILFAPNF